MAQYKLINLILLLLHSLFLWKHMCITYKAIIKLTALS